MHVSLSSRELNPRLSLTSATTAHSTTTTTTTTLATSVKSAMPASSYQDVQERADMPPLVCPIQEVQGRDGTVLYIFKVPESNDLCLSIVKPATDQVTSLDVFLALYYVRIGTDSTIVLVRRGQPVVRIEGWLIELFDTGYLKFGSALNKDKELFYRSIVDLSAGARSGFTSPWGNRCEFIVNIANNIKCAHHVSSTTSATISELRLNLESRIVEKSRRTAAKSRYSMITPKLSNKTSRPLSYPVAQPVYPSSRTLDPAPKASESFGLRMATPDDERLEATKVSKSQQSATARLLCGRVPIGISKIGNSENCGFDLSEKSDLLSRYPYRSGQYESMTGHGRINNVSQSNGAIPTIISASEPSISPALGYQSAPEADYQVFTPPLPPRAFPTRPQNTTIHVKEQNVADSMPVVLSHPLPPLPNSSDQVLIKRKPVSSSIKQLDSEVVQSMQQNNSSASTMPSENHHKHDSSESHLPPNSGEPDNRRRGKKTKLAKLIIYAEGQYMLDLVVAANLIMFNTQYNSGN